MTDKERESLVDNIFNEIKHIFDTKGADYAGSEDVLANFKEEAERLGLSPFQVLMIYKNKHERSINSAVKRNPDKPERKGESIQESVLDSIVYNILLLGLFADKQKEENQKHGEAI